MTVTAREYPWDMARVWPAHRPDRRLATAGDEHVFPAVVTERLSGEAAVECLHLQARDID
jgi:hypothetical protein